MRELFRELLRTLKLRSLISIKPAGFLQQRDVLDNIRAAADCLLKPPRYKTVLPKRCCPFPCYRLVTALTNHVKLIARLNSTLTFPRRKQSWPTCEPAPAEAPQKGEPTAAARGLRAHGGYGCHVDRFPGTLPAETFETAVKPPVRKRAGRSGTEPGCERALRWCEKAREGGKGGG